MKLLKFKVTQYKSIKDSGYCWLASDLTTLAGKNESGKSAILEALRDFDTDVKSIPDGAMPLDDSGEPIIELCFKPDKAELDEVASESGVTLEKEVRDFIGTAAYLKHKEERFRGNLRGLDLSRCEAFLLSDKATRALFLSEYEKTKSLYYSKRPSFDDIVASINKYLPKF